MTDPAPATADGDAATAVPETTRRRLAPRLPNDGWWSWLATAGVVAIAAIFRLVNLNKPPGKIFDEIYYAVDAHHLLQHGVEWDENSNTGSFVVHPPLGKWLIGLGELFRYDEFGWRISAAIAGIIAVLLITRLARRMFRSTVLGCAAGLLMAMDGFQFVLSRVALLDIFLLLFVLAAFYALVMDRDQRRRRWLRALENGLDPTAPGRAGRPPFAMPWWRLAAGALTGCAMAVKWSALWYIVLFVVLIYLWEVGTRRSAGVPHRFRDTLLDETGWVALFGLIIVGVYIASWTGWFLSDQGYDRHWLAAHGHSEPPIIGPLINLWEYHKEALHFHNTLTTPHTYQSWPWQWLLLGRPVAFYYSSAGPCGDASCSAEVLLLGTPVLWWSFIPALGLMAWFGISRRDWRALAIGLGALAGIVPWFPWQVDHRTMFYFYVAPAEPFLILSVVYVLGALVRGVARPGLTHSPGGTELLDPVDRRLIGAVFAGAYVLAVAVIFWYFYPIYVGKVITYAQWQARMWLGNRWI
jgi:dolichyl-phosphate-mannose--protein O-mannosyl transferase